MTTARDTDRGGAPLRRVLTAVVALYALVLQAVLGGIAALPVAAPFDPAASVHCLQQDAAAAASPEQAPVHDPADHHPGCCTLVHHPVAGDAAALAASTTVAWPNRVSVRLVHRMEGAVAARAPPNTLASARAPPVV